MYSKLTGVVDLQGKVCLVTGASKGIGKGIAVQLALHGAKCYITGRKVESLKEIAQEVKNLGGSGVCIPIQCDHSQDDQVSSVFAKIAEENSGKLDLLVNNAFSAVEFIAKNMTCKFWEQPLEAWDEINNVGLRNNYRCSVHAAKLMVERRNGLIINVSSVGGLRYLFSVPYGVGKAAKDRMAQDCAHELNKYGVAYISLWPGLVKTEFMEKSVAGSQVFGGRLNISSLKQAESPTFVGKTVAALLSEPHPQIMERSGLILLTMQVARAHGITDEEGRMPASMLQLNYLLGAAGFRTFASYIPNFIRVPFWMLTAAQAIRKTA